MSRRYNARSCSFHQFFRGMQCIHRRLGSFLHRWHLLGLKLMDRFRRNARTHRYRRPLVFLASLLVRSRVEGDEEHKVGA